MDTQPRAGAFMSASTPAAASRQAADAVEDRPDFVARSVTLASETLGIIAKIDLVEGEDGTVTPVDTKKGNARMSPKAPMSPSGFRCAPRR